jgi:hypothetical protein
MQRALLILSAVIMTLSATAGPACACSCIYMTAKEHADSADVVFTGKVREVRETDDGKAVARFRVRIVYKGNVRREVRISTASQSAACGFPFHEGSRYTVFAYRDDGLRTGLCSATRRGPIDPDRYGLPPGTRQ